MNSNILELPTLGKARIQQHDLTDKVITFQHLDAEGNPVGQEGQTVRYEDSEEQPFDPFDKEQVAQVIEDELQRGLSNAE